MESATTYYYLVQSTDASGNTVIDDNSGAYHTFTTLPLDKSPPPLIEDATGNTAGTTGEPATITTTITDNVGVTAAAVHYTPIGGMETTLPMSSSELGNNWSAQVPVAQNMVGTISYYITAQDAEGNLNRNPEAGTYSISITDNDAPLAEAGSNKTTQIGLATIFDGTSSTDNMEVTQASWDFDSRDGIQTESTGLTANHIYSAAGTYTATLTTQDEAGNIGTDTLQVTVTSSPTANVAVSLIKETNTRKNVLYRATATVTVRVEGAFLKGATVYGY